ncbi:hypothetical protein FKM82_022239 [Ascaphus truei]
MYSLEEEERGTLTKMVVEKWRETRSNGTDRLRRYPTGTKATTRTCHRSRGRRQGVPGVGRVQDIKIYSKLLDNKLSSILPRLIHRDQVGFVKDRQAADNTRRVIDVSHHPPAAAHHVYSRNGWTLRQEITIASKFRGKYLSIMPLGDIHLEFHSSGNHYVWRKVTSTVHNIIVGKLWIDQSGDIEIINYKTKDKCQIKFTPYSYFSRDIARKVTGVVTDANGKGHYVLSGTWDEKMECEKIVQSSHGNSSTEGKHKTVYQTLPSKLLWKKYPLPENAENMYFFSDLALTLNELEDGVAPTDSRQRPDQRLMEIGKWDEANVEKQRLEEKQRAVRRKREAEAVEALEEGKSDKVGILHFCFHDL